jgi:transcriptional regulator GlxA family with amidase domain
MSYVKTKSTVLFLLTLVTFILSCKDNKSASEEGKPENGISQEQTGQVESCSPRILERNHKEGLVLLTKGQKSELAKNRKKLSPDLPVIGVLMYDNVLTTELTAPMDVFTKRTEDGKQLFNFITIAESYDFIVSEEGLKMFPDYTLENSPKLDVLIVPSAYDMSLQVKNSNLVNFIRSQNSNTKYTVSNCAGATLVGESGIAKGKKIVTWIGGGDALQKTYPDLLVQDDANVSYIEDGKFLSSNGNLASYISSLKLLEKLSSKEHRKFVESYLYLDRLKEWESE